VSLAAVIAAQRDQHSIAHSISARGGGPGLRVLAGPVRSDRKQPPPGRQRSATLCGLAARVMPGLRE